MEDGKNMSKLNVLYEDNHIIVVVKPFNVLSQGDSTKDRSIMDDIKDSNVYYIDLVDGKNVSDALTEMLSSNDVNK